MHHWKLISLDRSLGASASAWDRLVAGEFNGHPLLSSAFVEGLLRHFGSGKEYLCAMEVHGEIQAMCILRPHNRFVWASFLPSQAQIGLTLIPDAALLPSLLRSLPGYVLRLDMLNNDPLVGGLVSNVRSGARKFNHALTIQVALSGTFDAYWESRSKKMQSNFRRHEKQLQADGLSQRHTQVNQPEKIIDAVNRYATLEGSGWKGREGTALGSTPEQLQFYQQLMLGFAKHGDAVVYELWFGDKLVASRLVIRRKQIVTFLKTTYDESMAAYAAGRLQLKAVIEDAFLTTPGGQLEFYTDATVDQLAWATDSRWIKNVAYYRSQAGIFLVTAQRALRAHHALPAADAGNKDGPNVEVYNHPDALPAEAQKLMAQAEQRNVELGVDWYRNLVNTVYPDCDGVRFYVLRQGSQVQAVLPLRAEKARLGWRLHSLSNYYTALYEPAMVPNLKPSALTTLLAVVRNDFKGANSFRLAPMDPQSHSFQTLLGALRLQGWMTFVFFAFGNWYLPAKSNWQDYLASRDGMLRSTLKRATKRFAGDGGTLQIMAKTVDMPAAIAAYQQVYAKSWKKPEPFVDFSPGLLTTCAHKGWLRLGIAWLKGQPIAAQVWIVTNGRAEIYKLAYDEDFKQYAPGTLLSAMLMEHVIETDRVVEVDYLIGDDPHKKAWVSHRRERWGIVAYNPKSLIGLAGFAREMFGRWVKPLLGKRGASKS